jgi:cytoskeletal protein RodZ
MATSNSPQTVMRRGRVDIGASLHHARLASGVTLEAISRTTKISIRSLKAIERNDFDHVPGGVFRRAYLRTFAAEVGLNADDIVNAYRSAFERDDDVELRPQVPHSHGRALTLAIVAAIVAISCLLAWQTLRGSRVAPAETLILTPAPPRDGLPPIGEL